jgi:hypothetical protein
MMPISPRRRALVLTDEGARHSFRRSLPPHVCGKLIAAWPRRSLREAFVDDWRSVFATYCAAFVAVSLFVA